MKISKAKTLDCRIAEFYSAVECDAFAMMLCRVIGKDNFWCKRRKSPKRYVFTFWATPQETEVIENLWDKVVQAKWEEAIESEFAHQA